MGIIPYQDGAKLRHYLEKLRVDLLMSWCYYTLLYYLPR